MSYPAGWSAPSAALYDILSLDASAHTMFTLPAIAVTRGGIQYPRHLTQEQQVARAEYDEAMCRWYKGPGGIETGEVWLAVREYAESDEVLEVCATPSRARAVCEHNAAHPVLGGEPDDLTWADEDATDTFARSADYRYHIERKPVMA